MPVRLRSIDAQMEEGRTMSDRSERRRKRYAEDPEYRERMLAANRRWTERNLEKIAAQKRDRWRTDPDFRAKRFAATLRSRYDITPDDYYQMLERQHGCCKVCFKPFTAFKRLPAIDHCHATGIVRGLLCKGCNTGIGFFGDDAARMRRAADHVEDPHAPLNPSVLAPCPLVLMTAAATRPWLERRLIFAAGPP
jgi:recombination endonuclease VII